MVLQRVVVVVVVVTVFAAALADGETIIFPGQLDHAEGEVCTTPSGETGTCERSCANPPTQGEPRRCGIKDSAFLVCCDKLLVSSPEPVLDISPPTVKFQCGRNHKFSVAGRGQGRDVRSALPPESLGTASNRGIPLTPRVFPIADSVFKLPKASGQNSPQVVGGVNAQKNAWPWMALLGTQDAKGIAWFCAGALINEEWVLSALHCFIDKTANIVRLGEHDYNRLDEGANHQDFGVAETVLYPGYNHPEAYHDVALLKLNARVKIQRHISPVCLPWGKESDKEITEQRVTLTGWGDTDFGGSPSSILQEVNVTVFPAAQCDRSYSRLPHYAATWPRGIGKETLCAGDPAGGRDACQGDSGGPLVSQDASRRYVMAGIVSRGYGCGHKDYPGLYANLRYPPYLAWIKKVAFATA